jgi:hypothetical protein
MPPSALRERGRGTLADHEAHVEEVAGHLESQPAGFVLVAETLEGPWTIVDRVHRSILLYRRNRLAGAQRDLGLSPAYATCPWHAARPGIEDAKAQLDAVVGAGILT